MLRYYPLKSSCLALVSLPFLTGCSDKTEKQKPNIVLIMADDLGYSDIGCYGGEISTPNLDALAEMGIRFTQFYNAARSCPSRASLLTGLYPHQTGIGHMTHKVYEGDTYQGFLNNSCVTIPEVIAPSGYSTNMVGKWHVGTEEVSWPSVRGFERFYGIHNWVDSYFNVLQSCDVYEDGVVVIPAMNRPENISNPGADWYTTDVFTDKALEYIDKSLTEKNPFFLYVAHNAPHWPLEAHDSVIAKYRGKYSEGWDVLISDKVERMKQMGILEADIEIPDQNLIEWSSLPDSIKSETEFRREIYAAQVEILDYNIGRIVSYLKDKGIYENTIIIFLSDNGCSAEPETEPFGYSWETNRERNYEDWKYNSARAGASQGLMWAVASNAPFRLYKKFIHEGGIATPMIISWPAGIRNPGSLEKNPAHISDIMPTIIEIAGAKYPESYKGNEITQMSGTSLLKTLKGKNTKPRKPIFWEHENHAGVRDGNWKLVTLDYTNPEMWELYDLSTDPTEIIDLAKTRTDQLSKMVVQWESWSEEVKVEPKERVRRD
jgi:arylsulfatase A-like enzyme